MPYCSKCGAELDKDATFCSRCGTPAGPIARRQRKPRRILAFVLTFLLAATVILAAILAAAFFYGGWHPFGQVIFGSGNLVTQEKFFDACMHVGVGSRFEVEITRSSSYSIKITADDNVINSVWVEASSGGLSAPNVLKIRLRHREGYRYKSVTLKAEITMPKLYQLSLSGGTHGTIKGFNSSHEFVAYLHEGSSLSGDFTTTGDAQFHLFGGSQLIKLDGTANNLDINALSGSHLNLSDFHVHDAKVTLSEGSHATINLDGRLDADLSGGSHLFYIGDPIMGDINATGSSTISRKK